jgi:glycosyltransferase involved in cell wall biosynthesis
LRVLYVINGLGTGGAERSLAESLPLLAQAGVEMTIVCQKRREEGVQEQVRRLASDLRFLDGGSIPRRIWELRRMIQAERFDLVHTSIFESDLLGRLAATGTGVPVLTSLVNTSYDPIRLADPNISRPGLWGARMIDGWTARHLTTHFHAITNAVKAYAVSALGIRPERITVVERGRDARRLGTSSTERRTAVRKRLGIPDEDELIVAVGRQEFQKGHLVLLRAASRLFSSRPATRILIAGRPGNASNALTRELERLGLHERVSLLGHREDVPDLLAAADVFAFPSFFEGLGGSLIEAMGMGLPIVASRIPVIQEVVEENGNALLVPPDDPDGLAGAITRLLDDRALSARFRRHSGELFGERYGIERSVERMVNLYRRVSRSDSGDSIAVLKENATQHVAGS